MTRRWITNPDITATFTGKGFQSSFVGNGIVANEWMKQEDANINSNDTMDILKYDCRLVGIDFTNANQNADSLILIAVSEAGSGSNMDRSYKWDLPTTNLRMASEANDLDGPTFNAGDKIAVYIVDQGGNASDVIITIDYIVTGSGNQTTSENFSGDLQFSDFPAIGSIPELFP